MRLLYRRATRALPRAAFGTGARPRPTRWCASMRVNCPDVAHAQDALEGVAEVILLEAVQQGVNERGQDQGD